MPVTIAPNPKQQFFNAAGQPLSGGKLFTYAPSTSTPKATYSDAAGAVANPNPIILDARGEALIYWDGSYSIALQDFLGNQIYTLDNYPNTGLAQIVAKVASIAALRALRVPQGSDAQTVIVDGFSTPLAWLPTSTAPDDGVKFFMPNSLSAGQPGRWVQRYIGAIAAQWFGLMADNTTDDGPAIQTALNIAAAVGGATVVLPNGAIKVATGLTMASNVRLEGQGAGTVMNFADGVTAISAAGTSSARLTGVSVRNLKLNKTSGTTGQHLVFTLCDDSDITGVVFSGALGANPCYAQLYGTRRTSTDGCVFQNGSSIIWSSSDTTATGAWGEGNTVTRCRMNGAVQGFDICYQKGFVGSSSVAIGSTGTYGCGFIIEMQNQGVILKGCVAYNHVRDGFYVEGKSGNGCQDIQLNGCIGYNNGEAGINLDANFKDVQIRGGAYYGNTGTFGAGTGHGIMGAGSSHVTIDGPALHNNAGDGINYNTAYLLKIVNPDIHDNTGWGINFQGAAPNTVRINKTTLLGNAAGTVNNWTYLGGNEWDEGPWQSYTPTFYKSDSTTAITFSTMSFVYRRNKGRVEYQLIAFTPSAAMDAATYFTIPIAGTWPGDSSAPSLRPRGFAGMDASGTQPVDGAYSNGKLRISKTAAADTTIRACGSYEVI